ncbi:hypothetical protein JCM3774_002314 [Rhodotorula dairenensis]
MFKKLWRSRKSSSAADKPSQQRRESPSTSEVEPAVARPLSSRSTTPLRGLGLAPAPAPATDSPALRRNGTADTLASGATSPRLEIRPVVDQSPSDPESCTVTALVDRNGRRQDGLLSVDSAQASGRNSAAAADDDRTVSPMSAFSLSASATTTFTTTSTDPDPRSRNASYVSHLYEAEDRDPTQIYGKFPAPAPTTWSEMVSPDLVANLSTRERTRQEILWEVVASEERYVAELRSLVEHYSTPLLHPHLSSSPHLSSPSLSPRPSSARTLSPYPSSPPTSNPSSADLPIASRFSRSPSPQRPHSVQPQPQQHHPRRNLSALDFADASYSSDELQNPRPSRQTYLGRPSLPDLPTGARRSTLSPLPAPPLVPVSTTPSSGRLSAFASRARDSLRPASSSRKLRQAEEKPESSSSAAALARPVPPLPDALRKVLKATIEMLQGHEDLSARLKEQWIRAFPLVRGLAAIWSDQPWFLHTYTEYIVSLEEALADLDIHLRAAAASTADRNRTKLSFKPAGTARDPDRTRIGLVLQSLEAQAAAAGESSMGICLSKPLMRLAKLPLLMQALLYHTDPTTHEWEKTRTMALEVDKLVRSIENEKVEEEDREKARDALARIDGIRDQALMAPRGVRVLLSEALAPPLVMPVPNSTRRHSSAPIKRQPGNNSKEWLITFSDVVVRAAKIGETDVPIGSSGIKEKTKQVKARKAGELRNTYRYIGIERWETPEAAEEALKAFYDRRSGREDGSVVAGETSCDSDNGDDAESQMSFRYDSDVPQPVVKSAGRSQNGGGGGGGGSQASPSQPAPTKFAGRLRDQNTSTSPAPPSQTQTWTQAQTQTRTWSPGNPHGKRRYDAQAVSGMLAAQQRVASPPSPQPRPREAFPSTPSPPSSSSSSSPTRGLIDSREDSTFGLYSIWAQEAERD